MNIIDWKTKAVELRKFNSWTETYRIIRLNNPELTDNKIRDAVRSKQPKKHVEVVRDKPTLVFSDLHLPYHHEGYLEFLKETHERFNCKEEVICVGDLVDHHAISRFNTEPDAMGDIDEFRIAHKEIQRLVKAFPKAVITLGNHDNISHRQAASLGISQRYMKSFSQLWDLPNTWKVVDDIIIDNVLYSHGMNAGGKDGALNKAVAEQISNVQGHIHSFGGCKYIASKRNLIFGLNTGCLCSPNSLAFAYGKHARYRPTLGAGIVFNDKFAMFVPWILE